MALGVDDKPDNMKPQKQMGVTYDPNATPDTMGGRRNKNGGKNTVPEYSGPPPTPPGMGGKGQGAGAPTLPPQTGPVFPEDAPMPIAYNGGYYNPTTAPYGFDMSMPGVGEQFWENNQNLWMQSPQLDWVDAMLPQFENPWIGEQTNQALLGSIAQPGAGQQFWNGIAGSFNSMGANVMGGYGGPNNAQEAYDMTKGMLPGSMQPQFDAYYDRMKDKVMSDVNSQSAARGSYGSNAALNNSIGAGLDMEAQRAKAATDFMLADSANQMNWQNTLGNQARGADLSGLGIFDANMRGAQFGLDKLGTFGDLAFRSEQMGLDKNKTLSDIAFGIDDQALERMGAGVSTALNSHQAHTGQLEGAFDAANIAQDQREGRVDNLYNDVSGMSNDVMGFFMQNYDQLINADAESLDDMLNTMISQTADQRGWDQQTQERIMRDTQALMDFLKGEEAQKAATGG